MGFKKPNEASFQAQVVKLAKLLGWRHYHTHDSRRSPGGFPDLVLVKKGRLVIYAELKSDTGKPTEEQTSWLDDLRAAAGLHVYLWRPSDFPEIVRILSE